jgi:hypothetical protein
MSTVDVAIAHAKGVLANPRATREEKSAAAAAAYHVVKRAGPQVLEAHVSPPHGVEKIVGQTIGDLVTTAKQLPAGLGRVGKAEALDVRDAAEGRAQFTRTGELAKAMGHETLTDLHHPLRHPGFTLLDALALATAGTAGARALTAAGRVAAEDASQAAARVSAARAAGARPTVAGAARGSVTAGKSVARAYGRGAKVTAQTPYRMAKNYFEHPPKAGLVVVRRGGQADRAEIPMPPRRRRYAMTPRGRL